MIKFTWTGGTTLSMLSGKRGLLQEERYDQYFREWPCMFFGIMHLCLLCQYFYELM